MACRTLRQQRQRALFPSNARTHMAVQAMHDPNAEVAEKWDAAWTVVAPYPTQTTRLYQKEIVRLRHTLKYIQAGHHLPSVGSTHAGVRGWRAAGLVEPNRAAAGGQGNTDPCEGAEG